MTSTTSSTERRGTSRTLALDDLRRRVTGRLTTPGDPGWDLARMAWVVNIPQHPMAVLEVRDVDDVIAAVRWAVDHGAQVTAQPTGHGANDTLEGAVILRTRALDTIDVDLERRTVWVGAGVKAGELCAALDGTGLVFLCGSNPDPTVVGMTITGGISWFGRAHGLGADSILAVELVDGLGRLRRVDAVEHPELFWAVRGGGGDFGVITRVEVALHPAPSVYGGQLLWPADRMTEVLTTFRDVTREAPDELTLWFHTWNFPPLPELPEPIRGKSFTGLALTYLGAPEEAEALLAPFRALGGLAMDTLGVVPLGMLSTVANEPADPMPGMQRSHLLETLDDATIAALVEVTGPGSDSPLTIVQIRHFGGAFAHTPEGAGSHGPVTEQYNLFVLGVPAVPELVGPIHARFDSVTAAVEGVASGRTLLNFLESGDDPSLWWSPETRARLVHAKQASDPLHTIRSNRPVRG
jgi:hypothetical protein